jgi:TIR domain
VIIRNKNRVSVLGQTAGPHATSVAIPDNGWNFFISHAGPDSSHAQAFRRAFEDQGATAFEDSLLPAGSEWDTEIPLHLAAAKVCVVLISVRTAEAHYERSEYQMAIELYRRDRTRRIVPIYLDRLSGAERPFGLGILSSIQLDDSFGVEDAAKQLVRESAEGRSLPTPGPRETASLVVPLLVALDDACRSIDDVDGPTTFSPLIETAIAAAVASQAEPDRAASSLRRTLRTRGLDARVLLTSSSDHSEAVRRWLGRDLDGPDPLPRGSLATLLVAFRQALGVALLSPTADAAAGIPEIARAYLRHLLTEPFAPAPPGLESFVSALEALLPPLRSFSRLAVLVSDSAHLARSEEERRHPSTRHVAAQMCRLPCADPLTTGIQSLVEQQSAQLLKAIAESGNAVTWYSGIPGVGASMVAIEVARAAADDFPGGVRYVDLRGLDPRSRRSPSNAVHLLAESLDVSMSGKSEEEEQFAALWSALEGRGFLIVLDNARDASHVARFLPVPVSCALIATSRDRLQSYASPGLACEVAPLSRQDSVALVSHAAGLSEDLAGLEAIAGLCDDLPLALRLAGAWMACHPELTPDHFARLLEDGLTRLDYLV